MEKLTIIRNNQELSQLLEYLKDKDFIAFDTETSNVDHDATIIGFSVCTDIDEAFYVILRKWNTIDNVLDEMDTVGPSRALIEALVGKNLVMHNAIFDCGVVNRVYGIELMPYVHTDTMLLGHLLNENRSNGLKELGVSIFGADAKKQQTDMKESVVANGGKLTKDCWEMYKADAELIALYGAKDAILTLKIFYVLVEELFAQGLDKFFYEEESMPLLRGPSYDLNTTGLKVDMEALAKLRGELEIESAALQSSVNYEVNEIVKEEYPGTSKAKTFNINSVQQMSWLLFNKLNNEFGLLTREGKLLCKALGLKIPYTRKAKWDFISTVKENADRVWESSKIDPKTKKVVKEKKVKNYWNYLAVGKAALEVLSLRYKWIEDLLQFKKLGKLLGTYVIGIRDKLEYGVIYSSFLQHGTTSGRYSSRDPNFQNLPRDDKRVKACIVSRPGMVFVGADYSQLEPRVFASVSQDPLLLKCFASGDDFYSVVGAEMFNIYNCSLKKDDENSFAKKHPEKRQVAKSVALAFTYGTTAPRAAMMIGCTMSEAQELIESYFTKFYKVKDFMLSTHEEVKESGISVSMYGRKRRIPRALEINMCYPEVPTNELPYEIRTSLNLAVNHKIQSAAASIVNRSSIKFWNFCRINEKINPLWGKVKIVLQCHDEIVVEAPEGIAQEVKAALQDAMENTVHLPGVLLIAQPVIAKNLKDLK